MLCCLLSTARSECKRRGEERRGEERRGSPRGSRPALRLLAVSPTRKARARVSYRAGPLWRARLARHVLYTYTYCAPYFANLNRGSRTRVLIADCRLPRGHLRQLFTRSCFPAARFSFLLCLFTSLPMFLFRLRLLTCLYILDTSQRSCSSSLA